MSEFPELKKVQDGWARSARDYLAKEIAQLEEELELTRTRMRELCDVASDWPSEAMNAIEILTCDRDAWKEAAVKAQIEGMQLTSDLRAVRAEKDALNERIAAIKVECVKAEAVLVFAVKIMEKW